ncbi:hypothetical protein [Tsuneonella suprasediminis]|uniref:hypothetical protein n=1 Tax=Tsuneonella suprasediminis TaxID=2306996 RepID=UPI002F92383F
MAIIPYPGDPKHQRVELQPIAAVQVNRSELSGARQAVDLGYSWWAAQIAVSPMRLDDARQYRLFFGRVRGAAHSFRVPVTAGPQHTGGYTVRAKGAGGGYSLLTDGWLPSANNLPAGDYVTVGDQLMVLDTDAISDADGNATLQFHSPLRGAIADNTVIETARPFLLAFLPDGSPALALTLAQIQEGFSFSAVEAY